jgi:hypothetical protein
MGTVSGGTEVMGSCDKCAKMVPAIDLVYRDRPFGRGEIRCCKGGC